MGNIIIKSGTDFREVTLNKVKVKKKNHFDDNIHHVQHEEQRVNHFVTSLYKDCVVLNVETQLIQVTNNMPEDDNIAVYIKELEAQTEEKFRQVIGYLATPVDARFNIVRHESAPINNFVADLVRIYMNTDCSIINSGSLRIDSIINEGELT